MELRPGVGHLHRLSRELQEKEKVIESLEVKLQERSESPGSSCPPSESSHSASSSSFTSEGLEPCSDGDAASEYSQCHEEPAQHTGTTRGHNCSASGHRDLASRGVPGSPEHQGGGVSASLSQSHCNNLSPSLSCL